MQRALLFLLCNILINNNIFIYIIKLMISCYFFVSKFVYFGIMLAIDSVFLGVFDEEVCVSKCNVGSELGVAQ